MHRPQDLLFNNYDTHQVCRGLPEGIKKAADELPDSDLIDGTIDEVVDRLVANHAIEVPTLDLANVQRDQDEVQVDVRRDPRRLMFGAGPHFVNGTKITWRIPFQGTPDLFHCRPSRFSLSGVRGDVDGNTLIIEVTRTDHDAQAYKKAYEDDLNSVQQNLTTLRSDTARLTDELRQAAFSRIQQRRDKRDKDRGLLDQL